LRILSPNRVAYLDLTGSGNETSAHVLENGRITFMFCAFEGAPQILRLYGRGHTALPGTPEWDELRPQFPSIPGARQIIIAIFNGCSRTVAMLSLCLITRENAIHSYVGQRPKVKRS